MHDIMKRIILQLDERTLADLDRAAGEESVSRAAFARAAIELALAERQRSREIADIIDSFRRVPQEDLAIPMDAVRRAWPD